MTRPIIRSIIRPIIRGIMRSNGGQILRSDLQNTLIAQRAFGSALPTYTRATTATVPDFESIIHTALAGEARFKGSRRVHNLIIASEDMENAAWEKAAQGAGSAPVLVSGSTYTFNPGATGGGDRSRFYQELGTTDVDADLGMSITLSASTNVDVILIFSGSSIDSGETISLTTTPKRFYHLSSNGTDTTPLFEIRAQGSISGAAAFNVTIDKAQLENVTGQANQNPSEYVSSGVLSSPYHGANVDAVQCFKTLNGNTVSDGTVADGPELVVNGDFATDTDWTEDVTWTISGGAANSSSSGNQRITQAGILSDSVRYLVTYTVLNYTSGNVKVECGSNQGTSRTANGTYAEEIVCSGGTDLRFAGFSAFTGSIDNISVKAMSSNVVTEATGIPITDVGVEAVTNGDFPTDLSGWTDNSTGSGSVIWSAGTARFSGTDGSNRGVLNQELTLVEGVDYTFEWEKSTSTGTTAIGVDAISSTSASQTGIQTGTSGSVTFTAAATSFLNIWCGSGGGTADFDNLSVKQKHYYADAKGPYGYMSEAAATNLALQSSIFENAAWTKTNVTAADNETTSPAGTTTAASLTATSANGTTIQDLGTISSAEHIGGFWLKRKTGTGDIDLTIDNGSTWTTAAVTSEWTRFASAAITAADPDIGIRIVTSTDAVYVWNGQAETGDFLSSDVENIASATTRNADVLTYPDVGNFLDLAGTAVCEASTDWSTAPSPKYPLSRDTSGRIMYINTNDAPTLIRSFEGTNSTESPTGTSMFNSPQAVATTWGAELTAYSPGTLQPDATSGSYDGTMGSGDIGIACRNDGALQLSGTNRLVKIFSNEKSAAEVLLLG